MSPSWATSVEPILQQQDGAGAEHGGDAVLYVPGVHPRATYEWSSDVWSLGCLLYELVALRNPFFKQGLNYYTLGKLITSCEYDPLPPRASPELTQLVAAMLQQDPAKRPSLREVAAFAEAARLRQRDRR